MKIVRIGFFAISSCLALETYAANWAHVATQTNGSMFYIDTLSFKSSKQKPNDVWVWSLAQEPIRPKTSKKFNVSSSKTMLHFSCLSKTYNILSRVSYDVSGNVINSSRGIGDYDFNMESIPPDTVIDALATYACTQLNITQ